MEDSTALGRNAMALHEDAAAIGAGATTLRDDQIVIGRANNTVTLTGVASSTSTAAQAGSISLVTTDDDGNLAAIDPNTLNFGGTSKYIAVTGDNTAIGDGAVSSAINTTAIGEASSASHDGSTAIGYGAKTTRENQISMGTATSTHTLAGVTSDASRAAQSGPTQYITSDANGNLAGDGGALNSRLGGFADDIDSNTAGIAMATAMSNIPQLSANKKFSLGLAFGTFEGESGYAAGVNVRITDQLVGRASVGGTSEGGFGGGAGLALEF